MESCGNTKPEETMTMRAKEDDHQQRDNEAVMPLRTPPSNSEL